MSVLKSLLKHELLQINESITAHESYDKAKTLADLRKSKKEIEDVLKSLPAEPAPDIN